MEKHELLKVKRPPYTHLKWRFVVPLHDLFAVTSYQSISNFQFPPGFEDLAICYNGGYPSPNRFITKEGTTYTMKSLLSFNQHDEESIWQINTSKALPVAFAIDDFGNLICFDRASGGIIVWDISSGYVDHVSYTFDEFLMSLH